MIGRTVQGSGTGIPILLTYDGMPLWKAGGLTIDWATVAAISGSDLTTPEGFVVPVGQKWLRYGQVLCQVTDSLVQTITVSGTPTGGTFALNVVNPRNGATGVVTLNYDDSPSEVQTALEAFYGAGNVTVSGAGNLPSNVLTVTFTGTLALTIVPVFALGLNALTGGTSPTAAFAVTAGSTAGKFGPYDPTASDGRQNLDRGKCFILNESIVQNGVGGITNTSFGINVDQVGAIYGGRVWKDRLLANDTAGSLAAGPEYSELFDAFPQLVPVEV